MITTIFLGLPLAVLDVSVDLYLLYQIMGLKNNLKIFVFQGFIVAGIVLTLVSSVETVYHLPSFLKLFFMIGFLWWILEKDVTRSLFYAIFTLSFTYFVKLFVSTFIVGDLLGIDHIVFEIVLSYFCVVPSYYLLLKYMTIRPSHLLISEQTIDMQQVAYMVPKTLSERERNIEKEQHHLIVLSNSMMLCFYLYSNVVRVTTDGNQDNDKYMIFTYVFLFIFMLYAINVKYKEWENQKLLRYKDYLVSGLTSYTQEVDKAYHSVRAFHHDFTNILLSMRETIATQEISEIRKTYADILEKSHIILAENRQEVAKLANIKILEVKSVISAKILQADMQGINIELELPERVDTLRVDKLDIVRLLGIMLDNAIDEMTELEMDKPTIKLAIFNKGLSRYYVVENRMRQEKLSTKLLLSEGYSTKSKHRGYGLTSLDAIVATYPWVSYHIQAKSYTYRIELEMRIR